MTRPHGESLGSFHWCRYYNYRTNVAVVTLDTLKRGIDTRYTVPTLRSMSFTKIDNGVLDSSLWIDRDARSLFMTALFMAEPLELRDPEQQIAVRSLALTGFEVPPGWYGFVRAAGIGIIHRDGLDREPGLEALERLGAPDEESRGKKFDGRRLVRINGGFIVLNYIEYRDRDYTSAARSKRWRERCKAKQLGEESNNPNTGHNGTTRDDTRCTTPDTRDSTLSEAEAEANKRGGEDAPPPQPVSNDEKPKAKQPASMKRLLAKHGLPNSDGDVDEWKGGLATVARVASVEEGEEFISWAVGVCREQGVTSIHWRHVARLAVEWHDSQKMNPAR